MFDAKALLDQLARGASQSASAQGGQTDGGLGDVLGQIQKSIGDISAGGAGGVAGMLGDALTQAVQGVKDGAEHSGAAAATREALGNTTGRSADELTQRARELVANNQLAAGAVLGGLGALVLGTKSGRNMAEGAAKLGALTLIGGLAYKAYQNHQAGKPLLDRSAGPSAGSSGSAVPAQAPKGSGFEPRSISNDSALRMIRVMIAAAAADGRIDDAERTRILAAIDQGGLDNEAKHFLAREIEAPSSAAAIAAGVSSPEEAAQIYTAARLACSPDTDEERSFLAELARALRLDPALAREIDTAARGAAA